MRKHFLLKTMLLLCALVVGSSSAWAADGDTHDFSQSLSQLLNNNANIASIDIAEQSYPVKKVIVSYRYNNTIADAVTIEVSVGGTSWGTFNVNGTGSNYVTQGFEGDAKTGAITISFTNNTGQGTKHGTFYVDKVQLVEGVLDSRTRIATIGDLSPAEIPFNGNGNFTLEVTPAAETATYSVSYASSDEDALYIDNDEYLAGTTKGTVTVTATVTPTDLETYKPVSKDFTVTIYDPNAGDGSEARPFSVAEALENTPASGTSDSYYIKGTVSRFYENATDIMSDGTNYRYYINDGSETDELLVYRGKNIGNVAFTQASDLSVGDEVVIYGGLTTYSSIKEVASGNYIVTLNGKKLPGISYATTSYNSLPAADFETPTLTNPNSLAVTYSSNNTAVATVDAGTGAVTLGEAEGTATITASFTGNDSFLPATASYTITTARAAANISFSETSVTITQGDEFTAPTFNNPNNLTGIVFTSSYNDVASVDDAGNITLGTATGFAVIKATYAQSVQYNAGEATCTITVNPAGVTPEPSVGGYYVKVTSTDDLEDGNYLVVYEDDNVALNGNLTSSNVDNGGNSITVSFDEDSNIVETTETSAAEFVLSGMDTNNDNVIDGYSIQSKSNEYYLTHSGTKNTLNTSEEAAINTIEFTNDGVAVIAVGNYHIRYNAASGQERFRYYTSDANVQLYKFVAASNPDNIDIYVSAAGMATYASNYDLDYTSVDGLKAYIAKEDGDKIVYEQVNKVPAGEGVLLRATDGGGKNYAVPTTTEDTDDMTDNKFVRGNDANVASNPEDGVYNYILNVVNNQIGFYRAANNKVAKNRAYLQTSINAGSGTGARILIEFDEEGNTTSIDVRSKMEDVRGEVYNLNGQRVAQPTKGLYIVNGKKFVVK